MSTQEKLEGKFEIEPGQILTIEANGYLKGTIISNDEDTLILSQSSLDQLIDSAKREAELEWQIDQTTELARQNFMYRCLYGEAPLEYKGVNTLVAYQTYREGDNFRKNFARYVEQLAVELEQSEESDK